MSERHIRDALETLRRDRTSLIIIAHRPSTIESADRIVVLKAGRIVDSGTHAELLRLNGAYAQLYRTQSQENGGPREDALAAATR